HKCHTCKLVDAAVKGGVGTVYEAKVLHPFRCKYDRRRYDAGDIYRHPKRERMEFLAAQHPPRVEWPPKHGKPAEPRHVGGGWYELADGRRVRGKEAALASMREG